MSTDVDNKADLTALNSKADLTALNEKADLSNALKIHPTSAQSVDISDYDINFTNGSQYIKFCKDGGYLELGGEDGGLTIEASAYLEILP